MIVELEGFGSGIGWNRGQYRIVCRLMAGAGPGKVLLSSLSQGRSSGGVSGAEGICRGVGGGLRSREALSFHHLKEEVTGCLSWRASVWLQAFAIVDKSSNSNDDDFSLSTFKLHLEEMQAFRWGTRILGVL